MRVTADTHRSNHAALLEAAARLFRARGLEAVSLAEVSAAAGLTHGAFYGHFRSKAALAEEACRTALDASVGKFRARAAASRAAGGDGLTGIIAGYLDEQHRDDAYEGCAIASLGVEAARGANTVRGAITDGTAALVAVMAEEIARDRGIADPTSCHDVALGAFAAMTGGLILARAFTDPAQSRAVLAAAAAAAHAAARLS